MVRNLKTKNLTPFKMEQLTNKRFKNLTKSVLLFFTVLTFLGGCTKSKIEINNDSSKRITYEGRIHKIDSYEQFTTFFTRNVYKKPTLLLEMMKELMKVYLFLKFLVNIQ